MSGADHWYDLASPALRADYRVPERGRTRIQVLEEGLAAPWRVAAACDSGARQAGRLGRGAFTAHLLTDDDTWALAVLDDGAWQTVGDRHDLVVAALAQAVVADSVAALAARFTAGNDLPWTVQTPSARLDVLGMLFDRNFPDREAAHLLTTLTLGVGVVEARRAAVSRDTAMRQAYGLAARRFRAMVAQARRERLLHRHEWHTANAEWNLRVAVRENWDETACTLGSGFAAVEHAIHRTYFGDVLDDLLA